MILAVDASSVTAAAALCSGDGAVVRSDFLHNGLTHSETLLPMIRRVLGDTSVADLDAIAVTAGPGSFTGCGSAWPPLKVLPLTGIFLVSPCLLWKQWRTSSRRRTQ